ncbi:MAG TPA: hypothetical protein VG370_05665 [Chloroflexota bacterium]|nr:hypothetical protein [Chloroflexota bacterium]
MLRTAMLVAMLVAVSLAAAPPAAAAPVPVPVCAEDRTWRRPSPDEMARTVWRDNRYADPATGAVSERVLAYYTHHFFFMTIVTANGVGKLLDWSGLATARPQGLGCAGGPAALLERREVVVYVLGYRVAAADVTGSTLTLTVEPNSPALDRGYAVVQAPRPGGLWYARFVLPDGREVARAASPDQECCAAETDPDARAVLGRFLDALLERNGPATLVWVTERLRAAAPHGFTGLSNPCVYRYAVEAFEQPTATSAAARVRLYQHMWPGDVAGGPPHSEVEELGLLRTDLGWLVDRFGPTLSTRAEPTEPHGPHTSACYVGRRPPVWLPAALPATGGPPAVVVPLAGALGLALVAAGLMVRRL